MQHPVSSGIVGIRDVSCLFTRVQSITATPEKLGMKKYDRQRKDRDNDDFKDD